MRFAVRLVVLVLAVASAAPATAQWQKTVEQIPQLSRLPDRTAELQQQIVSRDGNLQLVDSLIRITRPLEFDLERHGAVVVRSLVGTTLVMDGPGPALRFRGTHDGTASPKSFRPATWNERMPLVSGIEILGAHPEADGIELNRTVGPVLTKVAVRWCRHGIHLVTRNRNVIITGCHLYENSGVGVFLDDVNLHQINVGDCHISYNRAGGIVVRDGNVRNLQVSGCDIEGNMPADETPTTTANILIDVSGTPEDRSKSVAEIAITGCTIQHSANYSGAEDRTVAPGGANLRLVGKPVYPIDTVTVSGNLFSDTTTNVDITHAMDVVIGNNSFFAPRPDNLVVADSQRVTVTGNTFNPRQFERPGTIRFTNCRDCVLGLSTIHAFATPDGAVILDGCSGCTLSGLNLSDCGSGIRLRNSRDCTITGCRVTRTQPGAADLDIDAASSAIALSGNTFIGAVRVSETAVSD